MNEQENVTPNSQLGKNFEEKIFLDLSFSTKAVQYGDKHASALEPVNANFATSAYKNFDDLKNTVLRKHRNQCAFCGFKSKHNEIHNLNDVHSNIEETNLTVADPVCHAWSHLGEQPKNASYLAYLPDLNPTDINHLQRTLAIALESSDENLKSDAKEILNWLASHRLYVTNVWQSCEPTVFAEVLKKMDDDLHQKKNYVFHDLALIVNPFAYKKYVQTWLSENYRQFPISTWANVYHKYMHSA
ncbi:hypothetical protein L292_3169 [Acinetobacter junii CIP 107470 = MTCC 11364]|uniref:HNH nuclease domain-containing protein n=1 Tax=Acinetobacter junii CIP 107470 = MTCC 11364 TaxID=1217666 RepID=S7Y3Q8_ACIJU|nr:hypothetical protein [Acinetobacter junii]ENV52034.1 hypothetical protein F953_00524 [Acinetobacter junii CIP 107470 = MTCC 11364]EPR85839.1 hypothetical protein L292_3169 [Acinetobacter junii CIP 107470 = MTCC 11364]